MKKSEICLFFSFLILFYGLAFSTNLELTLPQIEYISYAQMEKLNTVRYAQCQLKYELFPNKKTGLSMVKDPEKLENKIRMCLQIGLEKKVNVFIFPELSLSLPEKMRENLLNDLFTFSKNNDLIIIGGSFYDDFRKNKVPIIIPSGIFYSYKIRQSKFEVSPLKGEGMEAGEKLLVLHTKYGNILVITCVDLISDDIQYIARYLSNRKLINILITISYNPVSMEFMREVSAIVKRHELFGLITNISNPNALSNDNSNCKDDNKYGNSSVFATINDEYKKNLIPLISDCFKDCNLETINSSYSTLIAQLNSNDEAMLICDLNLNVIRPPLVTNAPDQGYPPIKNIEKIFIQEK
ncbi:MAG: hypothetical protein NT166_24300 [Candidatus Aminicenantes bacterium]|nr:hypothetical protein [Candidatus Aminicenantes bacterium]